MLNVNLPKKQPELNSRVFLQRQLWILNYYVKSLSNKFSNENIKTGVSKNSSFWHFNSCFVLKTTETLVFMFSLLKLFDSVHFNRWIQLVMAILLVFLQLKKSRKGNNFFPTTMGPFLKTIQKHILYQNGIWNHG